MLASSVPEPRSWSSAKRASVNVTLVASAATRPWKLSALSCPGATESASGRPAQTASPRTDGTASSSVPAAGGGRLPVARSTWPLNASVSGAPWTRTVSGMRAWPNCDSGPDSKVSESAWPLIVAWPRALTSVALPSRASSVTFVTSRPGIAASASPRPASAASRATDGAARLNVPESAGRGSDCAFPSKRSEAPATPPARNRSGVGRLASTDASDTPSSANSSFSLRNSTSPAAASSLLALTVTRRFVAPISASGAGSAGNSGPIQRARRCGEATASVTVPVVRSGSLTLTVAFASRLTGADWIFIRTWPGVPPSRPRGAGALSSSVMRSPFQVRSPCAAIGESRPCASSRRLTPVSSCCALLRWSR